MGKAAHFAIHTYFQADYTFALYGVAPSPYFRFVHFRNRIGMTLQTDEKVPVFFPGINRCAWPGSSYGVKCRRSEASKAGSLA